MPREPWIVAFLILVSVAGCSQDAHAPTAASGAAVAIVPADGATGVPTNSTISMSFGVAVDRGTVERGFHLIREYDLMNPTCPDSLHHYHGSMMTVMGDASRMHHMDGYHSAHGGYGWGGGASQCLFHPDSLMRSGERYMIHLDHDLVHMLEDESGHMGGMDGHHGAGMMSGEVMTHFTTK